MEIGRVSLWLWLQKKCLEREPEWSEAEHMLKAERKVLWFPLTLQRIPDAYFYSKKSRSFKLWCWRWRVGKDKMGETFFCLLARDPKFYKRSSQENLIPIIICLVTFMTLMESSNFWVCIFFRYLLEGTDLQRPVMHRSPIIFSDMY